MAASHGGMRGPSGMRAWWVWHIPAMSQWESPGQGRQAQAPQPPRPPQRPLGVLPRRGLLPPQPVPLPQPRQDPLASPVSSVTRRKTRPPWGPEWPVFPGTVVLGFVPRVTLTATEEPSQGREVRAHGPLPPATPTPPLRRPPWHRPFRSCGAPPAPLVPLGPGSPGGEETSGRKSLSQSGSAGQRVTVAASCDVTTRTAACRTFGRSASPSFRRPFPGHPGGPGGREATGALSPALGQPEASPGRPGQRQAQSQPSASGSGTRRTAASPWRVPLAGFSGRRSRPGVSSWGSWVGVRAGSGFQGVAGWPAHARSLHHPHPGTPRDPHAVSVQLDMTRSKPRPPPPTPGSPSCQRRQPARPQLRPLGPEASHWAGRLRPSLPAASAGCRHLPSPSRAQRCCGRTRVQLGASEGARGPGCFRRGRGASDLSGRGAAVA